MDAGEKELQELSIQREEREKSFVDEQSRFCSLIEERGNSSDLWTMKSNYNTKIYLLGVINSVC